MTLIMYVVCIFLFVLRSFTFPRNSKIVSNIHCSVLYRIDSLSSYNWGKAVHSYLIKRLSRVFLALRQTKICLSGSVVVLQVHNTLCNDYLLFVLYLK